MISPLCKYSSLGHRMDKGRTSSIIVECNLSLFYDSEQKEDLDMLAVRLGEASKIAVECTLAHGVLGQIVCPLSYIKDTHGNPCTYFSFALLSIARCLFILRVFVYG